MNSYYSMDELKVLGFKSIGENVYVSRKASIYRVEAISMGNNVRIDDFCILSGNVTLGSYIHIAAYSALYAGKYEIILEDFSTISSRNVIYAESDDYLGASLSCPLIEGGYRATYGGNVIIKKHALIGSGCTILPKVTLGEGVSVGAMSLIKKDLDAWSVYAGIPAKKIAMRDMGILEVEKKFLNAFSHEGKDT